MKEPFWKSTRFYLALIGVIVAAAGHTFDLTDTQVWQILGTLLTFILARTYRNTPH